jgi:CS domain
MSDSIEPPPSTEQEERITWLRDRGVLIEFPNEADKAAKKAASTGKKSKIFIVKIPCDERQPFEEIEIPIEDEKKGDQLLELLLIYFNNVRLNTSVIDGLQKNQTTLFGTESVKVSDSTLQALGQKGSVEAFSLSRACEENSFCGVSFYLDEIGQIKNLPANSRAVALATICGFDNVPLVGDMFLGRTSTLPHKGLKHVDFRLTDMDSGASWLQGAKKENYEFGIKTGRAAVEGGGEKDYNGGENASKNYSWKDSDDAVEIALKTPMGTTSKEIAVVFRTRSVEVKIKSTGVSLLSVPSLFGSVDPDDCTWTFSASTTSKAPEIELTLVKSSSGMAWTALEV